MRKKLTAIIVALVIVICSFPVTANAASYPLALVSITDSNLTIPEGETAKVVFKIFPEYKNEKIFVNIYDENGYKVGSASHQFYNTSILYKEYYVTIDTDALDMTVGNYKIEYYMQYYSFMEWRTCPSTYKTTLTVIANKCNGNHNYKFNEIFLDGDCSKPSTDKYICSKCGNIIYQDGALGEHSWNNGVVKSNSTCTSRGTKIYTCTECDEEKTELLDMLPHQYDNGTVITEPTCESTGSKQYKCTSCGTKKTETLEMLPHKYNDGAILMEPSCKTIGYKQFTCIGCGQKKTEIIERLAHSVVIDPEMPATCTVPGRTEGSHCSVCAAVITEQIAIPAGHSWDSGIIYEEEEIIIYTCEKCGEIKNEAYITDKLSRVYGSNRYKTSLAIANEMKEKLDIDQFDTVIIASGVNFPDALAGSYLSTKMDAPILMANPDSKDNNKLIQDYLKENLVSNGKIYILGGSAAVPQTLENTLITKGYSVERLKGKGRYDTNLEILKEAGVANETILICTGTNFADSLSASATGLPILLVDPNTNKLSAAQIAFLSEQDSQLCIIGGSGAVSNTYENILAKYDSNGYIERIKGKNRYETSVEVADYFNYSPNSAVIASANAFPDGLCGGPLAYTMGAPLILTGDKYQPAAAYISENEILKGVALGGTGALKDNIVRAVFAVDETDDIVYKKYN